MTKYEEMTTRPVTKLVRNLALPSVVSMMITTIYNMADTAFVGQLGTSESGAVGVVFGFMSILQAVAFMCGQGTGSIISRKLGQKDTDNASRYTSTGVFLSMMFGALIGALSYIFLDPLVMLLGSTKTIAPHAKTYIKYIIIAAPFMTAGMTMNNILRYEGRAKLGMAGLITGAILNIFGDALLIFVFKMGIAGAGLATAVSQIISFCILLSMFIRKKTDTVISVKNILFSPKKIFNIVSTGFPSLLRQALSSIATMLLNTYSAAYGDEAVAAMSIVSRISFFILSVAIGIGQGFQPVSGFNYGAGKYDRVKKAYWYTVAFSEVIVVLISVAVGMFAEPLVRVFRDDVLVTEYAVRALRLQCMTVIFLPLTMVTEMAFQSSGQKLYASVASALRSGILFIPILIIMANIRGMNGIQEAQPLGYVLSFVVCVFFCRIFMKTLRQ